MYEGAQQFILGSESAEERALRREAFNFAFPYNPDIDVVDNPKENFIDRIERHIEENGDTKVLAKVLQALEAAYLMDVRANAHETWYVITEL